MALESLDLTEEEIAEMPMVDLVFELMNESGEPLNFSDIVARVQEIKGFTDEEMDEYLPQLYTEINIDGRFICVGRGLWGLREKFTLEQSTDAAVATSIKEDDELDDDPYFDEELDSDMLDDMSEEDELDIDEDGLFDEDLDDIADLD